MGESYNDVTSALNFSYLYYYKERKKICNLGKKLVNKGGWCGVALTHYVIAVASLWDLDLLQVGKTRFYAAFLPSFLWSWSLLQGPLKKASSLSTQFVAMNLK